MFRNAILTLGIIAILSSMAGCAEPNTATPADSNVQKSPPPAEVKKPEIIQWVEVDGQKWMVHDEKRPMAPVVTPGEASCDGKVGTAPSDAVILLEGNDVSKWEGVKKPGGPFPWNTGDGYIETVKDAGYIRTKQKFGSCQLHLEFATPEKVIGNFPGPRQQRRVPYGYL
jgi:hypothetical protein